MSKLSIAAVIEKNKIASSVAFIPLIDVNVYEPSTGAFVETLRGARNSEAVTFRGNVYAPVQFDLSFGSESGSQTTVELTIKDLSMTLQRYMELYGGGVGFGVTLHIVASDSLDKDSEISEFFEVIGASVDRITCTFQLGAENVLANSFPRRKQTRDFCQWRYKDPSTCRYSGTLPSCDLTLQGPNGCNAHNNTINFGGFPGIVIRQV